MKLGQAEKKIENKAIIRRMMDEGATLEEMMEATGYQRYTAYETMRQIRLETVQEENLTIAKHRKPETPIVEIDGKKYRDMTDVYLSSEWEGSEANDI